MTDVGLCAFVPSCLPSSQSILIVEDTTLRILETGVFQPFPVECDSF